MSFLGKAIVMKNLESSGAVRGARRLAGSGRKMSGGALELYGTTTRQTPRSMWQAAGRPGRGPINGRNVLSRSTRPSISAVRSPSGGIPMPPGRSRLHLAKNGKYIAAGVVGAAGVGAVMRRSGPAVDRTQGRPTGMYGY